MLEYTNFNNWYYGTGLKSIKSGTINIGVFNIQGICNLLKTIPEKQCEIFPIEVIAKDTTRLIRAISRELNPNCIEICRRFLADKNDFDNIPFNAHRFYNEGNNSLEENWNQFKKNTKIIEQLF